MCLIQILVYPLFVDLIGSTVTGERVHVPCVLLEALQVLRTVVNQHILVVDMAARQQQSYGSSEGEAAVAAVGGETFVTHIRTDQSGQVFRIGERMQAEPLVADTHTVGSRVDVLQYRRVGEGEREILLYQSRLFLRAEVSEKYYPYLRTISSANFRTPYNNEVYELNELSGRLLSFGKTSGDNSFYVPVTFEFDNKGEVIPGSFVEVYLLSSQLENVISVPRTALTEEQGIFFVYLQLDEEGYKKQEVTLGADNGKSVQILTGIKPGDRVVTEGAYQVRLASASNAIPAHSHEH